ncbi:MAG: MFS transporter, partial [Anaerolineae bacterium]|nr:MFS transporter [Anaerolineae bacterium]
MTSAIGSAFGAFQWPAYSAATTMLVPKEHLGRAGGLNQIGQAISQLFSPAIAGALFVAIGLEGIILIDFITFGAAVFTLFIIRIPEPERSVESEANKGTLWQEAKFGWTYITARRGLFGLLLYFASVNLLMGFMNPLFTPYLLGMTTPDIMGYIVSFAGSGMLFGSDCNERVGWAKNSCQGLRILRGVSGVSFILFGLRPSLILIAISGFLFFFSLPIMNALSQAIWQTKVEPDIQGRVFAVRRMIASGLLPIGVMLSGPLVDNVFEPLMAVDGMLASNLG